MLNKLRAIVDYASPAAVAKSILSFTAVEMALDCVATTINTVSCSIISSKVIDELMQKGTDISCLIYLTDLYANMPEQPDYPVLWACTSDLVADWGETLRIDA